MTSVFLTRRLDDLAATLLRPHFDVHVHDACEPLPVDELARVWREHDGLLATVSDRFPAELLARPGRVRAISNYAVGLDNIDLPAAAAHGIAIYHLPDVVSDSTADHTLALLLSWVRRVRAADAHVRAGRWLGWRPDAFLGEELRGKTLGILGFGRIGRCVARRAHGFGLHVLGHSRSIAPGTTLEGTEMVSLATLQARCDYLSLHVPLTAETHGLVDLAFLRRLTRRPLLVNTSRGDVVVTADLVSALEQGLLRGAALDVTAPEPLPASHPLAQFDNCLITPHVATSTHECRREMARLAALNLLRHFGKEA
jgi:phosphoglycerate dehydrogenase-like enzyme